MCISSSNAQFSIDDRNSNDRMFLQVGSDSQVQCADDRGSDHRR
jgi:hypothetical protein